MDTQDTKQAVIAALGSVPYSATYAGFNADGSGMDNMDRWSCKLGKESFEFFTGIGLREVSALAKRNIAAKYRDPRYSSQQMDPRRMQQLKDADIKAAALPVAPHAADLLHSLIMDADGCTESFDSWCDSYGYSNDSIKALETYRACQKNSGKLRRVLTPQQIDTIRELLSDY